MKQPAESTGAQVTSEEIKAVALVVGGLNEAARRLGLKPGTVRQRCVREGWMSDPGFRDTLATIDRKTGRAPSKQGLPLTLPSTRTPAEAIVAEMRDLGGKSRMNMARGLHKASAHIETLKGKAIVEDASNVKQTAQSLSIVHGWQDQNPNKLPFNIQLVCNISPEEPPSAPPEIEAEWTDVPPGQ